VRRRPYSVCIEEQPPFCQTLWGFPQHMAMRQTPIGFCGKPIRVCGAGLWEGDLIAFVSKSSPLSAKRYGPACRQTGFPSAHGQAANSHRFLRKTYQGLRGRFVGRRPYSVCVEEQPPFCQTLWGFPQHMAMRQTPIGLLQPLPFAFCLLPFAFPYPLLISNLNRYFPPSPASSIFFTMV
jgi:hypothetical protein